MMDSSQKNSKNLAFCRAKYDGKADEIARFIECVQLKDKALWQKFVNVFTLRTDIQNDGWRCEYWGKMMRGACMTYAYTSDETLYSILTQAVLKLLSTQDEFGRISGYNVQHEFRGWDIWGRKYVLVGLEYYYEICRDEKLKNQIVSAMIKHLDYIISKIGNSEGKIAITKTSCWWGGVNSCTILEPTVQLYKLTGKTEYKQFAEYIISMGGCENGDLIDAVLQGKKPSEFPTVKAYETMSFFEGVLAYYEISGNEQYLELVKSFAESVFDNEITVIGCAGCTHELFDDAVEKQTEYSETIMQETCVTVTWMRLLARLWENTNDAKYMDRIEQSALNALFGSVNTLLKDGYSFEKKSKVSALPFDSYSPLYNNARGKGIGGYMEFEDGGFYGCCACIGAAGTALYPLYAFVNRNDTIYVNFFLNGNTEFFTPQGQKAHLFIKTNYPADGNIEIKIKLDRAEKFTVALRIPSWSKNTEITLDGNSYISDCGYAVFNMLWKDSACINVKLNLEINELRKNGKVAFTYGAIVLARDEAKENSNIIEIVTPASKNNKLNYILDKVRDGEQLRLSLTCVDGNSVILTDYASCGKDWTADKNKITVWMNEK